LEIVNSNKRANQPEAVVLSTAKKVIKQSLNFEFYGDWNVLRIKRKYTYDEQ